MISLVILGVMVLDRQRTNRFRIGHAIGGAPDGWTHGPCATFARDAMIRPSLRQADLPLGHRRA